jgi:NitT/TauT family transport system substrate-binding protein
MGKEVVMKLYRLVFAALLGFVVVAPAAAEPLRISVGIWVGFGPLFLAQEKGFFREAGADVELVKLEGPKEGFLAMAAGRVDAVGASTGILPLYLKDKNAFQLVVALDDSAGGDGILARKDITTIAGLKGKSVAFDEGSLAQFFLNVVLERAGLTQEDVKAVNMSAGDAGAAFVAGKLDAAVTWEPWLTRGKASPNGHVLIDTSKTPGLVTDGLVFRREVLERRGAEVKAVVKSWNKAVDYWKANPDESNEIMAKAIGGWIEDPAVFKGTLAGVKFYDSSANITYFGTADQPGLAYKMMDDALKIWRKYGKVQVAADAKDLVNPNFVK